MKSNSKIVVVSYNNLRKKGFPYSNGIHKIKNVLVLVKGETFGAKRREDVVETNKDFIEIIDEVDSLEYIILFLGKSSSCSLEILDLFCAVLERKNKKHLLRIVSCHHDANDKLERLKYHDLNIETQYKSFEDYRVVYEDPTLQCNEVGAMFEMLNICISNFEKQ